MPLSTPSAANSSMNPWGSRESPSPSWYACRTTARLAFSRSVRWRLVSGSADGGTGAEPGRVAADAWPGSVPPASAATVGTAARAALRARNERRFVEDIVIPFDGQAAYVGWTPQGCSAQQGHEDLLRAGRGEVQHLLSCKQRASVSVVIAISPLGIDQGVSRLTAETVRGRHRIPVIYEGVTRRPRRACRGRGRSCGSAEALVHLQNDQARTALPLAGCPVSSSPSRYPGSREPARAREPRARGAAIVIAG